MIEEKLQEILGFFIFEPDNAPCEALIHIQRLLTSDGMLSYDRMEVFDFESRAPCLETSRDRPCDSMVD